MSPLSELPIRSAQRAKREAQTLSRREALRVLAAGVESGLASCSKPSEQIIPYVKMPERLVPGEPMRFATSLSLSGFGRGVIVVSIDGRPIKVEGNPRHPASLGATDVFAEAAVLSLYDPDRSRTILERNQIASEEAFRQALNDQLRDMREREGEGFRLLTARVTSPTLLRQIDALLQRYPKAAWSIASLASTVARHLLCGCAFPLHHGRRIGLGFLRRAALLVAQIHRTALSGILGEIRRHPDVFRL
jgi:hypothetical protein